MITKDIMNYKSYLKNHDEISIKLRVIKHRIVDKIKVKDIVLKYSMGRNTVTNIMRLYNSKASTELKNKLEKNISMSEKEVFTLGNFLFPKSRKPKSHPSQASISEEKQIVDWYEKTKVGAKRLLNNLSSRKEIGNLTLAKVKGVYKRKGFKATKVRTVTGEIRQLYNYEQIGAFDDGHYDTKILADSHSLPKEIYDNLKYNTNLPLYERNIIFAGSRTRFTGYSRGKSSTFGLQFLIYVLSHLRFNGVSNYIHMHTDGGMEFFSGSQRKQKEWNNVLKELDTDIDCYNPNWDIRKNLIERSHRSDDEEFLIAFGADMKTKNQFMDKAQDYNDYRNKSRIHSGKGMNNITPKQKLIKLGFHNADRILDFKVLYLDSHFYELQRHLEYFYFQRDLKSTNLEKLKIDRKNSIDLITKYQHLKLYAQNVLTYYLVYIFL